MFMFFVFFSFKLDNFNISKFLCLCDKENINEKLKKVTTTKIGSC